MTEEIPTIAQPASAILARIRAVRYRAGVICPRCTCARVYRWGSFSGRQRYRCRGCNRTFSDLTQTPAAYVKKLHMWEDQARLLEEGLSLRRVAAQLGICVSTAFDWRHRLLDELRLRDGATIGGSVQYTDLWFPYSEKGCWNPGRWRRDRGLRRRIGYRGPAVRVMVACDENRNVVTALLPDDRVRLNDLLAILAPKIVGPPVIRATTGPFSPAGRLALALRGTFEWVRGAARHERLANAEAYVHRFRRWLRRFCGVATHYLPNYLAWHRIAEATPLRKAVLEWPLDVDPTGVADQLTTPCAA